MHKAKKQLDEMIPRVQQVMRQTRERVLRGNTQAEGKLLSIFGVLIWPSKRARVEGFLLSAQTTPDFLVASDPTLKNSESRPTHSLPLSLRKSLI